MARSLRWAERMNEWEGIAEADRDADRPAAAARAVSGG